MKNIITILLLLPAIISNSHAIIPDGKSFQFDYSDITAGRSYSIDDGPNGVEKHFVKCFGGTLYLQTSYSDVLTYNPLTDKPYFCSWSFSTSKERGLFSITQKKASLSIHHKHPSK